MSWELVGLDTVHDRLSRALDAGRLHHATLLSGPAGSGKRTIARWLARSRLCRRGRTPGGCGHCGACRRVDTDQHPDLLLIAKPPGRAWIPVESVRAVIDDLQRGSLEGHGRVAVVAGADALNRQGQNSLLKTLEEPAPGAGLVLTAERPESLLETVRSRVERIAVPPLPAATVASLLARDGASPGDAERLAALAAGSLGRARELLREGWASLEPLVQPLVDGSSPPGAWTRAVLDSVAAGEGGRRQARRDRAREVLRLGVTSLRARAVAGDAPAWDAIEELLAALETLNLDVAAELVLRDAYARVAACRKTS